MIISSIACDYTSVGDHGEKDPPVPIPNTEVKLLIVENTWLATAREHRTLLEHLESTSSEVLFLFYYINLEQCSFTSFTLALQAMFPEPGNNALRRLCLLSRTLLEHLKNTYQKICVFFFLF